ncbi:5584_t:CDS:2 [Acaulospora morrowiae]|uniref:5584_t:CDS:1 n=1 Tax=Acaulospora morrowiae TaxID=94023 RepID=A0A9N9J859_9GLOM|nr:5584_t:CDS:2 [Acaulospora morrowiae]
MTTPKKRNESETTPNQKQPPDKLADRDRKAPFEDRQSRLESDLTKLMDYAHKLLHQRAAVVEYHAEVTTEKNVSSGPSEIDFETNIEELNHAVDTMGDERGSKIPYPTSPIANKVKITENAVIVDILMSIHPNSRSSPPATA